MKESTLRLPLKLMPRTQMGVASDAALIWTDLFCSFAASGVSD
jgi:hypothetical protein